MGPYLKTTLLSVSSYLAMLLFSTPGQAIGCLEQLQTDALKLGQAQVQRYQQMGSALTPDNQTIVLGTSTEKLTVLVHGFISRPADMLELAKPLVAAGHTVYIPLVTGFGADYRAANQVSALEWRSSVEASLTLATRCYPQVQIVAHSLGAALVTETFAKWAQDGLTPKNIKKTVLLAPYYRVFYPGLLALNAIIGKYADHISLADARILQGLTPQKSLAIPIPPAAPGDQENLPLVAAQAALNEQKQFLALPKPQIGVPALIYVSLDDRVIDSEGSAFVAQQCFSNLKIKWLGPPAKSNHYLHRASENSEFSELIKTLTGS